MIRRMFVTAAAFLHARMKWVRRRLTPGRMWRMFQGGNVVGTSLPPLFVPPGMEARAAAGDRQRPVPPPIFRTAAGPMAASAAGPMAAGSAGPMPMAAGSAGPMAASAAGPMAAGSAGPMAAGSTGPMAAGSTAAAPTAAGPAATSPAGPTTGAPARPAAQPVAQPVARPRPVQMPAASATGGNAVRAGAQPAIAPMPAPWASPASPAESARSAAVTPETQAGPQLESDRPAPSRPRLQRQTTEEPADRGDVAPTADGTLELLPGRMEVVRGADMKEIRFIRRRGGDTVVTFGRSDGDPHVHIRLEALTVSRIHAAVHYRAGRWYLENRSRTNPALVNGTVLDGDEPAVLADGDLVEMGEVLLRFRGP